MKLRIFLSAFLLSTLSFAQEADIRAVREQSNRAIVAHDLGTFAQSLTDDFVMVRGSGAFVASKHDYVELFRADKKTDPTYVRTTDQVELSTAAPLAAEHGHWIAKYPDGSTGYSGTYLAMWRHTPAGWQIRSELFVVLSCQNPAACQTYVPSTPHEK